MYIYVLIWLFEGFCLPYYRHPCSAACFPAPSGGNLRPFAGHGWATLGIRGNPGFSNANIFRRPPKIAPNLFSGYTEKCGKSAKKWGIGRRDLASQIAVLLCTEIIPYRDLGSTVVSVNLPKSGRSILQKSCFFCVFRKNPHFLCFFINFRYFLKGISIKIATFLDPGRSRPGQAIKIVTF